MLDESELEVPNTFLNINPYLFTVLERTFFIIKVLLVLIGNVNFKR